MIVPFIKFALLFCSVSCMNSFRLPSRVFTMRGVHNNLLVKIKRVATSTPSGLYIPDQSKERPSEGVVVAVGPGQFHPDSGDLLKMFAKVGDFVVYGKYDGIELKHNGEPHQIIKDNDILFTYKNQEKTVDNIECARGYALIQLPPKETTSQSGLVIHSSGESDTQGSLTGIVVRVGAGQQTHSGKELPVDVHAGDSVRFVEHDGSSRMKLEGVENIIVNTLSILAKEGK